MTYVGWSRPAILTFVAVALNVTRSGVDTGIPLGHIDGTVLVRHYIYNSETGDAHVEAVLDRLADREESIELHDVAAAEQRQDGLRDATLTLRNAVRIGRNPEKIYDADGHPDFSAGVLVTEESTGRRRLHIGEEALAVLEGDEPS